jgi:hypothetical protein
VIESCVRPFGLVVEPWLVTFLAKVDSQQPLSKQLTEEKKLFLQGASAQKLFFLFLNLLILLDAKLSFKINVLQGHLTTFSDLYEYIFRSI